MDYVAIFIIAVVVVACAIASIPNKTKGYHLRPTSIPKYEKGSFVNTMKCSNCGSIRRADDLFKGSCMICGGNMEVNRPMMYCFDEKSWLTSKEIQSRINSRQRKSGAHGNVG